jgi:hypothetical protein
MFGLQLLAFPGQYLEPLFLWIRPAGKPVKRSFSMRWSDFYKFIRLYTMGIWHFHNEEDVIFDQ